MSSLAGGGGTPPAPPPFHPIDVGKISNRALEQDIRRYFSYQFPVFPGLMDIRQREIEDAYRQLTSPLSPEFQSTFVRSAMGTQQQVTGGGDPYSGMAIRKGSFAKGAVSANVTRQTLAKQDYDRARFDALMQENPVPGLGLSQSDLLSMYVYNTGAANASAMQGYAQGIAGANAAYSNEMSTWSSIGNLISGLGRSYANYNMYNNMGGASTLTGYGGPTSF